MKLSFGDDSIHPIGPNNAGSNDRLYDNMHCKPPGVDNKNPPNFVQILHQINGLLVFGVVGDNFLIVFPIHLEFPQGTDYQRGVLVEVEVLFA